MSGFIKKIWKDRVTEFPTRRSLTKQDGSVDLVTVAREEGTVSQEGDAFSAQNMNDLEERVKTAFDAVDSSLKAYSGYGAPVDITSKSSESNPYTVPSDGIIVLNTSGENGVIFMTVVGGFTISCASNSQYNSDTTVLPVFMGMKLFETASSAGSRRALFIPYTEDNN